MCEQEIYTVLPPEPSLINITFQKTKEQRCDESNTCTVKGFRTHPIAFSLLCILASFMLGCFFRYSLTLINVLPTLEPFEKVGMDIITRSKVCQTSHVGVYAFAHLENMVHPALFTHPNPVNVLIVGGAKEDADTKVILAEVLRHKSVEVVAVVESFLTKTFSEQGNVGGGSLIYHNVPTADKKQVEYFDSIEVLHSSPFDVIILVRPFYFCSDVNMHKCSTNNEHTIKASNLLSSTIRSLSQNVFLTKGGVLVTHLGPSSFSNQRSKMHFQHDGNEDLKLELITEMTTNTQFKDFHIFEDDNGPQAQTIRVLQSYAVLCKDENCRRNWYADESWMNYQLSKRLSSTASYVDGSTLQRYTRPSKAWENLFCSVPKNSRQCSYMNGFNPAIPNIPWEDFEVKRSSVGKNAGRGLFTKVYIAEGSYLMQEVAVHQVKFSVQSFAIILKTKEMLLYLFNETTSRYYGDIEKQEHWYEIDSLISFMDGYGEDNDVFGSTHNVIDSGLSMFTNHGCNKTFNSGPIFFVFDRQSNISNSEYDYLLLSEEDADPNKPLMDVILDQQLFNPLIDRHLEHDLSCYDGSLSNIAIGQEILANYVHSYGTENWKYGIQDLRSLCRGEKFIRKEGVLVD